MSRGGGDTILRGKEYGKGGGLAVLKPGCLRVSWVDWPERQMGPGLWALGRRETDVCAQPAHTSRVGELARKSRWRGTVTGGAGKGMSP